MLIRVDPKLHWEKQKFFHIYPSLKASLGAIVNDYYLEMQPIFRIFRDVKSWEYSVL